MATRNQKVWDMVAERLEKEPKVNWADLKQEAEKIDKSIAKLSQRQFNARYPLQVSRVLKQDGSTDSADATEEAKATTEAAPATQEKASTNGKRRGRRGRRPKVEVGRESARQVMMDYARELLQVEDKAGAVDALAKLDTYLERIEKAYSLS